MSIFHLLQDFLHLDFFRPKHPGENDAEGDGTNDGPEESEIERQFVFCWDVDEWGHDGLLKKVLWARSLQTGRFGKGVFLGRGVKGAKRGGKHELTAIAVAGKKIMVIKAMLFMAEVSRLVSRVNCCCIRLYNCFHISIYLTSE